MRPPRRRRWHRQAAEALMALPDPEPDPNAVAYHLRAAADPRMTEWLIRAGFSPPYSPLYAPASAGRLAAHETT